VCGNADIRPADRLVENLHDPFKSIHDKHLRTTIIAVMMAESFPPRGLTSL
jgi:hypothetical protein